MQYTSILCLVMLSTAYARSYVKTLSVYNGGGWGNWGQAVFCPHGTFAVGYQIQVEKPQGDGDDTALNNIALICSDNTVVHGRANSQMWGNWLESRRCEDNHSYLSAFKLRVEAPQGRGDDTAANSIQFKCRNFGSGYSKVLHIDGDLSGVWGYWGGWSSECSQSSDICGLQIKFESWQQSGDDTALNDVKFFCCNRYA